jgi:hypothetical protein
MKSMAYSDQPMRLVLLHSAKIRQPICLRRDYRGSYMLDSDAGPDSAAAESVPPPLTPSRGAVPRASRNYEARHMRPKLSLLSK